MTTGGSHGNGNGRVPITFVATGLPMGGAELMLHKVLSELDRDRFAPAVISLSDLGVVGPRIQALGVPVEAAGLPLGGLSASGLRRLGHLLRRRRPAIVQTWLYHADLIGGLMARVATDAEVIWALRGAIDREASPWHTVAVTDACARVSRWVPTRIMSCSHELVDRHVGWGYTGDRMTVIPNGFDLELLRPDPEAPASVRAELGLSADRILVGVPARFHPQKDHATFVKAASIVAAQQDDVTFVLCGPDVTPENRELMELVEGAGIADRTLAIGRRDDMPRMMSAFDVVVSSSAFGEGFPNILGEAMACGTPGVTTDVGDARYVLGDTGPTVPIRDHEALAQAILSFTGLGPEERAEAGRRARTRVEDEFSLPSVVRRYEAMYEDLLARRGS
jgi:glycosyltransferase involved in cell wall biosynthesis